ncbi:MAG: ribosome rescue GTPase HflX [Gammaproteobacteria bacterium]
MFDRPQQGERAILVHLEIHYAESSDDLDELVELAESAGAEIAGVITGSRNTPDPKYFVGKGKLDEIKSLIESSEAELVIFDHSLSPAQERNIEAVLECRVLDRTGLILDIFAQRASTFEGNLQVELAQLKHLSTRLIRGWTHLERQKGGIGLRGPGETQLETDRRLIGARIKQINSRLEKVRSQRDESRKSRRRADISSISLVGYTNAGKSTLFNHLTGAKVYAADQLFATLDPTLRRIQIPGAGPLVLSDTVGFIRHLPHDLVAAFRATLEETRQADLLLHIIDASSDERLERIENVKDVIEEMGAGKVPVIEVWNKIDLLEGVAPRIDYGDDGLPKRVWLSSVTGEGVEQLFIAITDFFRQYKTSSWLSIDMSAGQVRAKLYEMGAVVEEKLGNEAIWQLKVELPQSHLDHFCQEEGVSSLPQIS